MAATSVLFSFLALLVTMCCATEFNCTVGKCTGNGMKSIVLSGTRMCCPPAASFNINNGDCKCVGPTVTEEPCGEGVPQCRQAAVFGPDSKGNVRCCRPGYVLNNVANQYINGVLLDVCTCTPANSPGGFMSTFLGMTNGASPFSVSRNTAPGPPAFGFGGASQNPNATGVRSEWKKIADDWRSWTSGVGQGFRTWGRNFGQSMRSTDLDLARNLSGVLQTTMQRSVVPLQRAFNDMISNAFRAIPGFNGP